MLFFMTFCMLPVHLLQFITKWASEIASIRADPNRAEKMVNSKNLKNKCISYGEAYGGCHDKPYILSWWEMGFRNGN
jgi:hypothetical protein